MKSIRLSKQAEKFLRKQDKISFNRIMAAIYHLPKGNVKKLQGFDSMYRLRVGDFRVLYNDKGEILDIIKIGNRGSVYNRL